MSDIREQFVTIDIINRGVSVKKFEGGGSYKATVLEGTTLDGHEFKKNLSHDLLDKVPSLQSAIDDLNEGDLVKIVSEKKGKYNNIRSIFKEGTKGYEAPSLAAVSNTGGSTGGKSSYNTEGMIKGNAITNAVQLAIATKKTGKDDIVTLAKMMLEVHKEIESVQMSSVGSTEVETNSTVDVNDPKQAAEMF